MDGAPDWSSMLGGYRTPYDPRAAISRLDTDPLDSATWKELWNELHHQGELGESSYAAVPEIVRACRKGPRDWNFHGLISVIEFQRHRKTNPPLPAWLRSSYKEALNRARELALVDVLNPADVWTGRSAMAVIALVSGDIKLGALLLDLSEDDWNELADDRWCWSELYREGEV